VPALLRRFGERTNRKAESESWAAKVEQSLATLLEEEDREPFRYVYLIWKNPWMLAAEGTYIADVVSLAGGVPAFSLSGSHNAERTTHNPSLGHSHNAQRTTHNLPYPEVTEGEIAAANPDVVLLPDEPYRFGEKDRSFWAERLPHSEVKLVSGDDFCWHGVRTLRGIEAARELRSSRIPSAVR